MTRAVIASFVARDVAGSMALEWVTVSEVGTVGFYLKRWEEGEGKYVDVNERLIRSLVTSPQGGVYRYLDRDVVPGEPYRYLLVEVEASGRRLTYGPYDVDTRTETTAAVDADADADAIADTAAADATLLDQGDSRTPRHRRLARGPACPDFGPFERARPSARSASAAKISVAENGLYYVSLEELQAQGGVSAPVQRSESYALTNRGTSVAFTLSSDQKGILFYGRAPESNVEAANVYRVSKGSQAPDA